MSRQRRSKPVPRKKDTSKSTEKSRPPSGSHTSLASKNSKTGSKLTLNVSDREEFLTGEIEQVLSELKGNDDVAANLAVLDRFKQLIGVSTGFASIPQALKILYGHYGTMKELYEKKKDSAVKSRLATVLSFIATSKPTSSEGDVLRYFLLGEDQSRVNVWGIAYVRDLVKDILEKWKVGTEKENCIAMGALVSNCAKYYLEQNSEIEAVDLLLDTNQVDLLQSLITLDEVCVKVCKYISTCAPYLPEPENINVLYSATNMWLKFGHFVEALFLAVQLQNVAVIEKIFSLCPDMHLLKQMAFILARHNVSIDAKAAKPEVACILGNSHLSKHFLAVAKQLDILEPKGPEDVVKPQAHLRRRRPAAQAPVPVASSLMSGFINAAFGTDKHLLTDESWLEKTKDLELITTTGTLGLLYLWDVEALSKVDKYVHSSNPCIQAGALLATGLINCTTKSEFDPTYALLHEHLTDQSKEIQLGAIVGLGLAYCGSKHGNAIKSILNLVRNEKTLPYTAGIGALSCGLIANSSADGTLISSLIETLATRFCDINSKASRNIIHAIGLCAMGKVEMLPTLLEAIQVVPSEPVRKYLKLFVEICAYSGSSNILKVQELFKLVGDVEESQRRGNSRNPSQSRTSNGGRRKKLVSKRATSDTETLLKTTAVLGIGLISVGDELNSQMLLRNFAQLLQIGDAPLQSASILAIALMYLSNPVTSIIEILGKFTHSPDIGVAINAILAMGLISAGSNNAKVSKMLVDLSAYYTSRQPTVFAIKVAQGLLHLGKGSLTLSPLMEGRLVRHSSLAGVFLLLLQCLQSESALFATHYYLFYLACAIRPKMLVTLDADSLEPVAVSVRVGQQVDTTGQAGKPRTVTGFQTLTTPVLLNTKEVAELATDDYTPLSCYLEGFVLLKRKAKPTTLETSGSALSAGQQKKA